MYQKNITQTNFILSNIDNSDKSKHR